MLDCLLGSVRALMKCLATKQQLCCYEINVLILLALENNVPQNTSNITNFISFGPLFKLQGTIPPSLISSSDLKKPLHPGTPTWCIVCILRSKAIAQSDMTTFRGQFDKYNQSADGQSNE